MRSETTHLLLPKAHMPTLIPRSCSLRLAQIWRASVLLSLLLIQALAYAQVSPGLYYDRTRSGHGLDLQRSGAVLFGTFFTYDAQGAPTWYFLQTNNAALVRGELLRVSRPPGAGVTLVKQGDFSLTTVTTCPDGVRRDEARTFLLFDFVLPDGPAQFCLESLLPASEVPVTSLNGARFQPGDSGWGLLSFYFPEASGAAQTFKTLYYHDRTGFPRWALAQGPAAKFALNLRLRALRGSCRYCPVDAATATDVGPLDVTIISNQNLPSNRARLDVRDSQGSVFARDTVLTLLSDAAPIAGTASTREGLVVGEVLADRQQVFRRIPFVAPPLAELRFQPPKALVPRTEPLMTDRFGDGCMQAAALGALSSIVTSTSEDCLQLNIWRPANPGPHPVMVWIHGGGLTQGSAVERTGSGRLTYDGSPFSRRDVVLVTINYRLGPLGYAAHREFQGESGAHPNPGNYGVLDQIAALRWVRDNIAQFGGNPDNVTIFGESAGGVSTCALMATAEARGLFERAVMQSGNCRLGLPTRELAFEQGDRLRAKYGCSTASDVRACLRTLPASLVIERAEPTINTGSPSGIGETFGLIVDGQILSEQVGDAIAAGRAAKVPLIIGVNDDEQTTLTPESTLPSTVPTYEASVRSAFGLALGNRVLAAYPANAYPTPQAAYQDLLDDLRFTCPNRRAAADHASAGNAVYHYVLSEILPDPQLSPLESFHGLDVVLLFGPRPSARSSEIMVAEQMQGAWVQFARTGNPGVVQGRQWPQYSAIARTAMQFQGSGNTQPIDDYRFAFCVFWATVTRL